MISVTEINSPQELANLRAVWNDLFAATPGASFFQSHAWLETYWHFFGYGVNAGDNCPSLINGAGVKNDSQGTSSSSVRPERLRVLLIEADGEPIGILPLVVSTENYRVGPIRVLGYPLAGWGSFYGPVGPHPAATLLAGLQHIRSTPRDWDLLDLRWIDAGEVDRGNTPQALQAAGFNFQSQIWHHSAQVELENGWKAYWATRKPTWRSNVRRCERLLNRRGTLRYVRYRPGAPNVATTIHVGTFMMLAWS